MRLIRFRRIVNTMRAWYQGRGWHIGLAKAIVIMDKCARGLLLYLSLVPIVEKGSKVAIPT